MDIITKVGEYAVLQHMNPAGGIVTQVALSANGCVAYKAGKNSNFFLALVESFFCYAFTVGFGLNIVLNGHKGAAGMFAPNIYENAFIVHTVVYLLVNYTPNNYVGKALAHKVVAPLITSIVLVNTAGCALAAVNANAATGFPFALIAGYLVWHSGCFLKGDSASLESIASASITLIPYSQYDRLSGLLKGVSKDQFVIALAVIQFLSVQAEVYTGFSLVAKTVELYNKVVSFASKQNKKVSSAAKRAMTPPKSPKSAKKSPKK